MLIPASLIDEIKAPEISMPALEQDSSKNIFAPKERKAWHADTAEEARCDLSPNSFSIHPKAGVWFAALWKRTVKGRTLREIKADDEMVPFFALNLAPFIAGCLGRFLRKGQFAIVTTPARRHTERNFGELTAKAIADELDIRFYPRCATARTKQRIGAIFDAANIPEEPNVIVFDDIVTTGSTFASMHRLLTEHQKNCLFFAGISNH